MKKLLGPLAVLIGAALVTVAALKLTEQPELEPGVVQVQVLAPDGDIVPCRATLYVVPEPGRKLMARDSSQSCDERGQLTWTAREPGDYHLMAMSEGAAMLEHSFTLAEGPGQSVGPLSFQPGGRVFGLVTHEGQPVGGADVRVTGGGNGRTGDNGKYRIEGVAVGEIEVRAGVGIHGAGKTVELQAGQTLQVDLELETVGSPGQVGVQLEDRDGAVVIARLRPGWPAEASLRPLDELVQVNGQDVTDRTQAKALMAGEPDQPLVLTVRRDGETHDVELVRASAEETP